MSTQLYRKEQYETHRDIGDGERAGEDMVTYRTRFVPVEPCEHGMIDAHYTEYNPLKDHRLDGHQCEGAGLENPE